LTPDGISARAKFTSRPSLAFSYTGSVTARHSSSGHQPNFAALYKEWNYGTSTEGATYIRRGGHHVGHRPTFYSSWFLFSFSLSFSSATARQILGTLRSTATSPVSAFAILRCSAFSIDVLRLYGLLFNASEKAGIAIRSRGLGSYVVKNFGSILFGLISTRMWANAQRDSRPAEYRWRPLFNAAKCG